MKQKNPSPISSEEASVIEIHDNGSLLADIVEVVPEADGVFSASVDFAGTTDDVKNFARKHGVSFEISPHSTNGWPDVTFTGTFAAMKSVLEEYLGPDLSESDKKKLASLTEDQVTASL